MKKKICVYGLVRGYNKLNLYKSLIRRNNLINRYVKSNEYEIDYILFHEGNISKKHKNFIAEKTELKFKFINLKNKLFKFDKNDQKLHSLSNTREDPLGYKYMCMFHTYLSFIYLRRYILSIRIDEDLFLYSKLDDRLFNYILKNNFYYIFYRNKVETHSITNLTLFKYINKLYKNNDFLNLLYNKTGGLPNFSTSFTIFRPEVFLQKKIKRFLKRIYFSNNIIKYRWGDHTLQAIALIKFLDLKKLLFLKNIKILHSSQYYAVSNKKINEWKYKGMNVLNINNYNEKDSFEYFLYSYFYKLIQFIKKNQFLLKLIRQARALIEK